MAAGKGVDRSAAIGVPHAHKYGVDGRFKRSVLWCSYNLWGCVIFFMCC